MFRPRRRHPSVVLVRNFNDKAFAWLELTWGTAVLGIRLLCTCRYLAIRNRVCWQVADIQGPQEFILRFRPYAESQNTVDPRRPYSELRFIGLGRHKAQRHDWSAKNKPQASPK